ncbi:hypothetical protein CEXT_792081 [Caerostris extrusa]|uniref:Uncharacterized protein n=1 Tax=Caerostris extrusa TaxID=172846 RepID=A0AAV4TAY5_CAEEX|nr:hypothetical protein CEXT_792081 [Caerostris extrusa]
MQHVISVPFRHRRLANEREINVSPSNSLDRAAENGQLSSRGRRTESSRGTNIRKRGDGLNRHEIQTFGKVINCFYPPFMERSKNRSSEKEGWNVFEVGKESVGVKREGVDVISRRDLSFAIRRFRVGF